MAPDRPWKDEYTLLCERCGYVIEGLARTGACPECGKPITESLPERRTGTPWRCQPGIRALGATWWMTLRHPMRTLDLVRPSRRHDRSLARWSILTGALLMAVGWGSPSFFDSASRGLVTLLAWGVVVALGAVAVAPVLFLLTLIETQGLGIIARTRSFRISRESRRAITAHGSVGWVVAGMMFWTMIFLAEVMIDSLREPPGSFDFISSPELRSMYEAMPGPAPRWAYWIAWSMQGFGLLAGFLFFEIFAYLGLRRLKFANRERPMALRRPRPPTEPDDDQPSER